MRVPYPGGRHFGRVNGSPQGHRRSSSPCDGRCGREEERASSKEGMTRRDVAHGATPASKLPRTALRARGHCHPRSTEGGGGGSAQAQRWGRNCRVTLFVMVTAWPSVCPRGGRQTSLRGRRARPPSASPKSGTSKSKEQPTLHHLAASDWAGYHLASQWLRGLTRHTKTFVVEQVQSPFDWAGSRTRAQSKPLPVNGNLFPGTTRSANDPTVLPTFRYGANQMPG